MAEQVIKRWVESWLVDFYEGDPREGKLIETKEVERAYAPTRWAKNYAWSLRRKVNGAEVNFSISKC